MNVSVMSSVSVVSDQCQCQMRWVSVSSWISVGDKSSQCHIRWMSVSCRVLVSCQINVSVKSSQINISVKWDECQCRVESVSATSQVSVISDECQCQVRLFEHCWVSSGQWWVIQWSVWWVSGSREWHKRLRMSSWSFWFPADNGNVYTMLPIFSLTSFHWTRLLCW